MLYITDDIRIRRQDKLNVIIERKSDPNKVPKHLKDKVKSDEEKWLAETYHSSYDQAIHHIVSKDLLVDDDKVNSIGDYLDEVRRVKELLRDVTHVTDEKVATLKESKSKNIKL